MDRRYFLRSVLGLSALPIAESVSASVPAGEPQAVGATQLVEGPVAQGHAPQESVALSSGLRDLDRLTNGLAPGSVIVVASRPSLGKSLLVLQIADHIARAKRRAVTIVCADDGAATAAKRLISLRAGVWPWALVPGSRLNVNAQKRVQSAVSQADTVPILLDDTRRLTVTEIADRASKFALERCVPLGIVIVDSGEVLTGERGRSACDRVAAELRAMSERLQVPVAITALVSRAVERRRDKRPRITDFAEPNAAFVRAADVVLAIYRDEVYDIDSPDAGVAELALLWRRFGKLGMVRVRLGEGRFEDC